MKRFAKLSRLGALTALVIIAGCGGGGGGGGYFPVSATPAMPTPAAQSPYDAFLAYLKALVETSLDSAEPADVAAYDPPPVSDSLEPVATQ